MTPAHVAGQFHASSPFIISDATTAFIAIQLSHIIITLSYF